MLRTYFDLAQAARHAEAANEIIEHVAGILAKAAEFRDQIATALRAADLMIAEVEAGREPEPTPPPAPKPASTNPRPPSDRPAPGQGHRKPREGS